jgi:hypothetical protein
MNVPPLIVHAYVAPLVEGTDAAPVAKALMDPGAVMVALGAEQALAPAKVIIAGLLMPDASGL